MLKTVSRYAALIRRRWMWAVVPILTCTAIASLYVTTRPAQYTSTAKLFVATASGTSLSDLTQGSDFSQSVVSSYVDVATTAIVLAPVAESLGESNDVAALSKQVQVSNPPSTVLLQVEATDPSPARAAKVASLVSQQLKTVITNITPRVTGDESLRLTVIQPASVPQAPSGLPWWAIVALGFIAGGVVGISLAGARDSLATRIRTARELEEGYALPLLETIPKDQAFQITPIQVGNSSSTAHAERFRSLSAKVRFFGIDSSASTLVVVSAVPGEGKTTAAVNLALALAETSDSVLVIDGDLRRPKLADYFGIDGTLGLTDVLMGSSTLGQATQRAGLGQIVDVLPAGAVPPNPLELLQSTAMKRLMGEIQANYHYVIIDGPPVLPVADSAVLAREFGSALVVAGHEKVTRQQVQAAAKTLHQFEVRALGVVYSQVPSSVSNTYGYYGGYAYGGPSHDVKRATPNTSTVDSPSTTATHSE